MFSAIQWAKNHGFQIFHLGSGQRSLLDYKMKFANRKRDLNIGFNIYNPGLYSKLLSTIPEDKKMISEFVYPAYQIGQKLGFLSVCIENIDMIRNAQ
jgi:hypothetical protein